jgi:hypothetical protein
MIGITMSVVMRAMCGMFWVCVNVVVNICEI